VAGGDGKGTDIVVFADKSASAMLKRPAGCLCCWRRPTQRVSSVVRLSSRR
jgi:hypothetical protein